MMKANLVEVLSKVSGASFVAIDTETVVNLTGGQSNPQKGRVTKRITGSSVMVFQNKNINGYEAMVNRRLEAEGKDPSDFELKPRQWGDRVPNMPIVKHVKDGQTKFYLEVIFLKPGTKQYLLDGQPIDESQIQGLPVTKDDPDSQGGLGNKVIVRSFSVDSLRAIRCDGAEHIGPF